MNEAITTIGLTQQPRMTSHYRLQWEEVQKSWVLLYPEGMVKLNGSAAEIMRLIDGVKTVQNLIDDLENKFQATNLKPDVLSFLGIAQAQGWVKL